MVERPADQTTLTRRYTEEAVRFIREQRARPFFLYLAHTFPHVPLFASHDFLGQSLAGATATRWRRSIGAWAASWRR